MASAVSMLGGYEGRLSKMCAKQASPLTELNSTQNDILRMLLEKLGQRQSEELLLDESTLHGGDGDVCEQLEVYLKRRARLAAEEGARETYRAVRDARAPQVSRNSQHNNRPLISACLPACLPSRLLVY